MIATAGIVALPPSLQVANSPTQKRRSNRHRSSKSSSGRRIKAAKVFEKENDEFRTWVWVDTLEGMDPSSHISNEDDNEEDDSEDDEFGNITADHQEDNKKRKKKRTRMVEQKLGSIPKHSSIIRFDSDGRITSSRQCDICICKCRSTSHRIIRLLPTTPYQTEILSGHGITGALYTSENRDPIRVDASIGSNSGTTTPLVDITWFCSVLGSTEKYSTRVDIYRYIYIHTMY
jgi:hypothetical protein